jgi:hypothetical protein
MGNYRPKHRASTGQEYTPELRATLNTRSREWYYREKIRLMARRASANAKSVNTPRQRGRPKLGDYRLECMLPKAVWNELIRRENAGQGYRTRIAADILTVELIGHINAPGGLPHQIRPR